MNIDEHDLRYLESEYRRCDSMVTTEKPFLTYAMRREAAALLINLAGYSLDRDTGRIIKRRQEYLFPKDDGTKG